MKNKKNIEVDQSSIDEISNRISSLILTGTDIYAKPEKELEIIKSPILSMDMILGTGGFPKGKIIHLWGGQHAGKSMFAFSSIKAAQDQGIPCVLIDIEAASDIELMRNIGIDTDKLKIVLAGTLEGACTVIRDLSDTGAFIVVDSIGGAVSGNELSRNLSKDSPKVGGNAFLWGNTMGVIRTPAEIYGTTYMFINQVRAKIGAMFGEPIRPSGPESILHNVDVSIFVSRAKEKNATLSSKGYYTSRFRIDKNRFSDSGDSVTVPFKPGFSYNTPLDLVRIAKKNIHQSSQITYGELSKNIILADHIADPSNEKEVKSGKNRFVIKVDPLMMRAILWDEEDFDSVKIEPVETWDGFEVGEVDEDNYAYFTIPGAGELNAAKWFAKHQNAEYVITKRMPTYLQDRHEALKEDI